MTHRVLNRVITVALSLTCSLVAQAVQVGPSQAKQDEPWPPPGVVPMCHCDRDPVLVRDKKPDYPKKAMDAGIQGVVQLEAVVEPNGKVSAVRVVRSLDKKYGLDDEAVRAVKQWKFKPLKAQDGAAAPVLVNMEVSFWSRR